MSENPLSNYFRTPTIHISLPSGGKFYPKGTLNMPKNKELPVYPMTAVDEITYRTPDSLFNGSSVTKVIESCVPAIKDAWAIPNIDLDTILAAIRIASYGHNMEIATECPKCKETSDYELDLRTVIERLDEGVIDDEVQVGDLEIHIRPLSYKEINEGSMIQFEEQKVNDTLNNADISEQDKLKILSVTFEKISKLTLDTLAKSIDYVKTPETVVKDANQIYEFLNNCDRNIYEKVRDSVYKLREKNGVKPLHIVCDACGHEYDQPYTLDMSNFFG